MLRTNWSGRAICAVVVCVSLISVNAQADLSDGLMAYYPFDGNANDLSGNGNNATVYGAQLTTDRFGGTNLAYLFDGFNDTIEAPHSASLDITGPITVSCWVKAENTYWRSGLVIKAPDHDPSVGYHLRSGYDKAHLGLYYGVGGTHYGAGAASNTSITDDQWRLVTGTYDGSTIRMYVDGQLETSTPYTAGYDSNTAALQIGHYYYPYADGHGGRNDVSLNGAIDDVRIYDRALSATEVGTLATPAPTQSGRASLSYTSLPAPTAGARKLAFITHGLEGSVDVPWVKELAGKVASELPGTSDGGSSVGKHYKYSVGDWDIVAFDWQEGADTTWLPGPASSNGFAQGVKVGKDLALSDYEEIHFYGKSAGSWLIDGACDTLRQEDAKANHTRRVVQSTFLDAYAPIGTGPNGLGDTASWAEHFVDNRFVPFTNATLEAAYNVDVTSRDNSNTQTPFQWHQWPVEWYMDTIDSVEPEDNGWGFNRSLEMGTMPSYGGDWLPGSREYLLGTGPSGTFLSRRLDDVLIVFDLAHVVSHTGTVDVIGTAFSMLTGSPVWITVVVEPGDPVNFLTFEAEFTSQEGAEGLLAIYWGNELIGTLDEHFLLDGPQEYLLALPETFDPGIYAISFRLDPYTGVDSSVMIDNVATGYVVPEPATLSLLALGGLAMLRRWRKA